MKKAVEKVSPARQLVTLVWEHNREATGHSWLRVNQSMHKAVTLAIEAGMRFDVDDFATIYRTMRGGHWFNSDERFYQTAVEFDHLSACQSYEAWRGRPPFVHQGQRLAVRSALYGWPMPRGERAPVVTSFADDGQSLTACTYKRDGNGVPTSDVKQRIRVTLVALRARERELEKLKAKPKAAPEEQA